MSYCVAKAFLDIVAPTRLGAGTTRLCAGIVSVAKPISIECEMANYSSSLYQQLEVETGVKTGQTLHIICLYSYLTYLTDLLLFILRKVSYIANNFTIGANK